MSPLLLLLFALALSVAVGRNGGTHHRAGVVNASRHTPECVHAYPFVLLTAAVLTTHLLNSGPECADVLGRSIHATESLLARARNAFRTTYEETGGHDD